MWIYLALSGIGLISALVFNVLAVTAGQNYGAAWTGSAADWVLTSDLGVVAIALVIFMLAEGKRLGMTRVWVYIALSCVTAMAFTFPLFLAIRERHMAQQGQAS
jgi:hypothetical protein